MFSITVKPGKPPVSCATSPACNGLASTSDTAEITSGLRALVASLDNLEERLASRSKISPQDFSDTMSLRERTHHLGEFMHEEQTLYY